MRVGMIAVAAAAACAAVPAQATVLVKVDVYATGTIERIEDACRGVCSVTPTAQAFSFSDGVDLAEGQSYTFSSGPRPDGAAYTGTITRSGYDTYGNVAYLGSNFSYVRSVLIGGTPSTATGAILTRLSAASFTVHQTIPAPVPEPATWLTMILGFGAIGYAMRRKTVLRFV